MNPVTKLDNFPGVFIVGSGRSGTTLLRLMLDNHPNIHIADESEFLSVFYGYEKFDFSNEKMRYRIISDIEHFYRKMFPNDTDHYWKDLISEHKENIVQASSNFKTLVRNIYSFLLNDESVRIWGDNTPQYISIADHIRSWFPKAKFIHLIRDGRDVHLSMARLAWGPNYIYWSAKYWKSIIQLGKYWQRKWPDEWLDITYEELLKDPEKTLKKITVFLKIPYDTIMLSFHKTAHQKLPPSLLKEQFQKTTAPVDPKNCFKWKHQMPEEDVRLFEKIAGYELSMYGYKRILPDNEVENDLRMTRYILPEARARIKNLFRHPTGGKAVLYYKYFLPLLYQIKSMSGTHAKTVS
ncbi:sulfotransferase [bacterium]|nr:sulfotransferase [candidate division CSSED10-310 bacterium]